MNVILFVIQITCYFKNKNLTIFFSFKEGETATATVTDLTAKFREKFFQASHMTKEERANMKCLFPRDKRGQGLGYRLTETQTKHSSTQDGTSGKAASSSTGMPVPETSLSEQRNNCDGSLLTDNSECHNELEKDRSKEKCNEASEQCSLSQEEQERRREDTSGSDAVQSTA